MTDNNEPGDEFKHLSVEALSMAKHILESVTSGGFINSDTFMVSIYYIMEFLSDLYSSDLFENFQTTHEMYGLNSSIFEAFREYYPPEDDNKIN